MKASVTTMTEPAFNPGDREDPSRWLEELAGRLRELREGYGNPSYRAMARKALYSHTALVRAAGGKIFPSWDLTAAFVKACDGDLDHWRSVWTFYERKYHAGNAGTRDGDAAPEAVVNKPIRRDSTAADSDEPARPDPAGITNRAELTAALRSMRLESGMSLRNVQQASMRHTHTISAKYARNGLPISTTSNLCNTTLTQFPEYEAVHVFLLAMGVPEDELIRWRRAYNRARQCHDRERTEARNVVLEVGLHPGGVYVGDGSGSGTFYNKPLSRWWGRRFTVVTLAGVIVVALLALMWTWRLWYVRYMDSWEFTSTVWELGIATFVVIVAFTVIVLFVRHLELRAKQLELDRLDRERQYMIQRERDRPVEI